MSFPSDMPFSPADLGGLVVATCFAAGLNLYATILTLGVLARFQWVALPHGLDILGSLPVLIVSGAMFAAEFIADKIPGFDLIWNAAHTFIRVPVAALLAYRATEHLTPGMQLAATAAGGLIAMATHSSKTALRAVVTPSPEPVSNIALSTTEDAAAIGMTYAASHHPLAAAGVSGALILLALLCAAWILRRLRGAWARLTSRFQQGRTIPVSQPFLGS